MASISQIEATVTWNLLATLPLPDADITVLVALANGEVDSGFHDGDVWRYVDASRIDHEVEAWADFPSHPHVS